LSPSSKNNTPLILGIVIPVVLLNVIAFGVILFLKIRKRQSEKASIPLTTLNMSSDTSLSSIAIQSLLGKGNFGEVYLGIWGRRKVALKKLNELQSAELEKEANILQSLNHPNIVRYYGIAHIDGNNYMVMGILSSLLPLQ
jgi:serine/threonine protein kinase